MENKRKALMIIVSLALVALLILIFSLIFSAMSDSAPNAKVDNIILPSQPITNNYKSPVINLHDSDNDETDSEDNSPIISGLPDKTIGFGQTITLDLDNYASDDEDSHSELDFTIVYTSSASPKPLTMSINSANVLTITESNGVWTGMETVTIRVEDTDGNTDEDSFRVNVTNGTSSIVPVISGLSNIEFADGESYSFDLDGYVNDADTADADLTWTYSGNTNVLISINSTTHVITFASVAGWTGSESITFRVTDPQGNSDNETITVTVNPASTVVIWQFLSSQTINEDSALGTVVYSNIVSKVYGVSSPVITIASSNIHFSLGMSGNDLVLNRIDKNWYGSETVTLSCNGVTSSFTLNVNQLNDDCVEICSFGKCYSYCD